MISSGLQSLLRKPDQESSLTANIGAPSPFTAYAQTFQENWWLHISIEELKLDMIVQFPMNTILVSTHLSVPLKMELHKDIPADGDSHHSRRYLLCTCYMRGHKNPGPW